MPIVDEDPLVAAARAGDVEAARAHVEAGGDLNGRGWAGQTALQRCLSDYATDAQVWFTPERETIFRLLIEKGADLLATSNDGWRALTTASVLGNLKGLAILFEHGDAVRNPEDWKALHFCVQYRNPESARVLLQHGADPDVRDGDERTALMRAARLSNVELVGLLLEHGADPNAADKDGWTALMFAATKAKAENVDLLLSAGADAGALNAAGETALDIARAKRKTKVAAALERA